MRIASTKAFAKGQDDDEVAVASNVFDYYAARPQEQEGLTLCNFVTDYDLVSAQPRSGEWFEIDGANRYAKRRGRPAILRSYPRMTPEAHGEEYYYQFLLLHCPWRQERHDLLAGHETYEEAFAALEPQLQGNIANANFADEVQAAVVRIQALQESDRQNIHRAVAPGAMEMHQEHEEAGALLDEEYAAANGEHFLDLNAAFAEEDAIGHANVGELVGDVMLELDDATRGAGFGRMSNSQFQRHRDQLSNEQRAIFREVQDHIRSSQSTDVSARPPPLRLFITGGAGVGKSFLIEALHELIIRGHMGVARKPVKLTAPTGVAAFNIMGTTLHTALSVPVEHCRRTGRSRVRYIKLNDQKLQALRAQWAGTKYLIIDEVSMVSYEMLSFVHRRLMEIMDNDMPFGGVSVICIGDFFQLPPVKANFVFHQEPGASLHGHLWKDPEFGFKGRVLLQNQRQRGDTGWATHLNALRDCVDEEAVDRAAAALQSRLTISAGGQLDENSPEWIDAPRLFPKTDMVASYNDDRLRQLQNEGNTLYEVRAGHSIIQRNGRVQHVVPTRNQLPNNADDCGGLEEMVRLSKGARVMLRRNVDVDDGLVNGAVGTKVDFEWPEGRAEAANVMPAAVFVRFDNARVGSHWRRAQGITDTSAAVRILPSLAAFQHNGKSWQRVQFPFTLAWALTIHKVQGLSMDRAAVELGKDIFADGQAYVALSRVKTLDGLAITGLCENSIRMVSVAALQEYVRLGIDGYSMADVSRASQRARSLPSGNANPDGDDNPLPWMAVDGNGEGMQPDASSSFPPTPPRPQIPMAFARSPQNSSPMFAQGLGWAATTSALLTLSRSKRRRICNVASNQRRGGSQSRGSGGEEGGGGEVRAGRHQRRLSSQFTPLPRLLFDSPIRYVV